MTNWGTYKDDLASLKAMPTTTLNKGVPAILDDIWYFYNPISTITADDYLVIKPNDSTVGRWIINGYELLGHLNQPNNWEASQRSAPTVLTIDSLNPTLAIDCKQSNYFLLAATQNFSIATPTNSESGRWFILSVEQSATPFVMSWSGSNFKFLGKVEPQLTPETGAIDEFFFRCRSGGGSPVWLISPANNFGVA